MRTSGRRVAVALGAGGARGYAHIGAIQVLQERGYEVVALAGTSMGALVAGVMAAGKLEAYTEWSLSLTQREVLRLLDPTLTGGGAIRGERVIGKVGEILEGARIEDLVIPYTAVATDLGARREVWFQRGPVITAIRASVSIPGVITPVVVEGRLLVDGGLMNPVPIEPTAAITSDWTLAVSLSGPRSVGMGGGAQEEQQPASPVRTVAATRALEELGDRLRASAAGVLESETVRALSHRWAAIAGSEALESSDAQHDAESAVEDVTDEAVSRELSGVDDQDDVGNDGDDVRDAGVPTANRGATRESLQAGSAGSLESDGSYEPAPRDLGTMDVFNRSFDTMAALITRYRMAGNPPDVLVTVPSDACRTMDFHRAAEMIDLGRRLTEEALDAAGR